MARSKEQVLDYLIQVETLSNEILADKHALMSLDKERQQIREALRKLKTTFDANLEEKKHYCAFNNTFLKLDNSSVIDMLQKDQQILDAKIKQIRDRMPRKVELFEEARGRCLNSGFTNLKSINT